MRFWHKRVRIDNCIQIMQTFEITARNMVFTYNNEELKIKWSEYPISIRESSIMPIVPKTNSFISGNSYLLFLAYPASRQWRRYNKLPAVHLYTIVLCKLFENSHKLTGIVTEHKTRSTMYHTERAPVTEACPVCCRVVNHTPKIIREQGDQAQIPTFRAKVRVVHSTISTHSVIKRHKISKIS